MYKITTQGARRKTSSFAKASEDKSRQKEKGKRKKEKGK